MALRIEERGITFDDILLIPEYSTVTSRLSSELSLESRFTRKTKMQLPFVSSPMFSVTDASFAMQIGSLGGKGIVHRFHEPIKQIGCEACAVGVKDYERTDILYKSGVRIFCIDVASGHNILVGEDIKLYKDKYPGIEIIAGNVVTAEGAYYLLSCGVDAIRCGVGPGAACGTRVATGCGVPQLTAIKWCYEGVHNNIPIIADGGIRTSGDIVKAFAFGASSVMMGRLFAPYSDAGNDMIDNRKLYYGQASKEFQDKYRGGMKSGTASEGVVCKLYKADNTLEEFVSELSGGVRSAMSYLNCRTIEDLRDVEYIVISGSSIREGLPSK
jgi:IMP dehydrogenase